MSENNKQNNECPDGKHDFEACAWRKSFFDKAASSLFCRKCGKVIPTGIEWESDGN